MTPKTLKLLTFGLTSLVVALVVTFGLYVPYLKAYNLVHPARVPFERFPAAVGIAHYEEVHFTTSDNLTLKGWYVPPQGKGVVIFLHGLGSDRTELLDEAGLVVADGYGALLFDLRSCGQSDGKVATMGYLERRDVRAAVDFVHSRAGADFPVALFGHSMGAGTALLSAAEMPEVGAVIVESAFTTLEDNVNDGVRALTGLPPFPFAGLVVFFSEQETGLNLHTIRPLDVIAQISPRAVLLIHGEKDAVIPVHNSITLYAAAKEPKQLYILPAATHGLFLQAEPKVFPETVLRFLNTYLKKP